MTENKTASSGERVEKYIPPKGWSLLTADEKIERMREQIKHALSTIYRLENITRRQRVLIAKHRHADGKVVEDVGEYESLGNNTVGDCSEKSSSSEVYF